MAKLSESLAANVRASRARLNMSQAQVATMMERLGHKWSGVVVANAESGLRRLSVDEIGALALVLGQSIPELLAPAEGRLDLGLPQSLTLSPDIEDLWLRGEVRTRLTLGGNAISHIGRTTAAEEVVRSQWQARFGTTEP